MMLIWLFLPGSLAYGNAWYSSSSKSVLSHPDPAVFVAKTAIDLCTLPPDLGGCTKELVRYYYDPVVDDCKRFLFTGCGGNSNRFMRRTHCRGRCVKNRLKLQSSHEPSYDGKIGVDHRDIKHRRTLTTTSSTTTTITTTKEPFTQAFPVTPVLKPIPKIPIPSAITQCPHCDPLFGVCVNGECGCIAGFKKLGRICIDINECEQEPPVCPTNSRCTNSMGAYRCDCDAGYTENGECKIEEGACTDEFDIQLTEEDCNNGEQLIRYYFDRETVSCRKIFYGGCKSTSRNIFNDIQTCNTLCMNQEIKPRDPEPTIPVKIKINFEPATTQLSSQENVEEALKIVKIMHHINPNENPCSHPFDEDVREECVLAHWEERFFWNPLVRECEPFWYDATCPPQRTAGKNFFESLFDCQSKCGEEVSGRADEQMVLEAPRTTTKVKATMLSDDPYKLVVPTTVQPLPTTTVKPQSSVPIQAVGNFEAKTAVTRFDKEKFMAEYRKKLNALPDNYSKKSFDVNNFATKRPLFTLFPQETVRSQENKLNTTLFKEVTPVSTTMLHVTGSVKVPLDLSQFMTKRPPFTLNPAMFGELIDTSQNIVEEETTRSIGLASTHNPLDLSKFVTKRPPLIIFVTDSPNTVTNPTTMHQSPLGAKSLLTTPNPLDLSKFATKRPPFTFDLALLKEEAKTSARQPEVSRNIYDKTELDRHLYDVYSNERQDENSIVHSNVPSTRMTFPPQHKLTTEKEQIASFLDEMNAPIDLCEEPLHPSLEEDCSGDDWVLRWYFNSDRGTCKTFWYGGCTTEARNFFKSKELCKIACSHKMPPSEGGFNPKYVVQADTTTTTTTRPTTTEMPAIERSFIDIKTRGGEVFLPVKSGEIDEVKDKKLRYITLPPTTTMTSPIMTTTVKTSGDPCDDGYDEQWDSDCSGDNWEVKAYYDNKSNSCKRFWWGGCSTPNRNIWKDTQACLDACGHELNAGKHLLSPEPSAAEYGTAEPPSNMVDVFKLPTASALVGDRSLTDPVSQKKQSRRNRQKLHLKWNVVQTDYKIEKDRKLWDIQKDAPVSSSEDERPAYATKEHFEADLQRKLATEKREYEGRADLEYSSAVDHPVTIASECLEPFDVRLSKSCSNGSFWTNRYFFDPDIRGCRMFWNDGCASYSGNNFPDIETCQWKCEGRHPEPERAKACLQPFDLSYLEDCRHGEYGNRFYFDHDRKRCTAFHWGGCRSESANFFTELGDCQELCETPPRHLTQSCIEPFDESYKDSCSADGRYLQYYYFDHATHTCKMFWYANCKGEAQNIYPTLETCQWICERHREERSPSYCLDHFDSKYRESCGEGRWTEKWYFDHNIGNCASFWWDGCVSTSQNIFSDEKTCKLHCTSPGHVVESKQPEPDTKFRCLELMEVGTCKNTYPAFYYDRETKKCSPFAYSGCGGNGNRFMTRSQCENLCFVFNDMPEPEMDCHHPLHIGYGQSDNVCLETAGYRYYFDRDYGRCTQFWFMGCGGNANNFYSYDVCMRTCRVERRRLERKPRASSTACYKPSAVSTKCPSKISRPVQRWTYHAMKCTTFSYSGCGGNDNRFYTKDDCRDTCANNKPSADAAVCSFEPDVGPCNQLRYKWFYNQTRGTCDQFLYGGCEGNVNRFDTFEECQKKCEVSGLDPCMEPLDRGNWCEAMSNRYYFNKKSKQCRGFHYTGCGKSGNNFLSQEECHNKCELRYPKKRATPQPKISSKKKQPLKSGYSGAKPPIKTAMIRHIELNGSNKTYYKSDPEWIDYSLCLGYRYNVSGRNTKLQAHLCAHNGDAGCYSEVFQTTEGEEYCQVLRPFIRGTQLYTWYFALDLKHLALLGLEDLYDKDASSGDEQVQRDYETTANILQLKANHCHEIC